MLMSQSSMSMRAERVGMSGLLRDADMAPGRVSLVLYQTDLV